MKHTKEELTALSIAAAKFKKSPSLIKNNMWVKAWLWDEGLSESDLHRYIREQGDLYKITDGGAL